MINGLPLILLIEDFFFFFFCCHTERKSFSPEVSIAIE